MRPQQNRRISNGRRGGNGIMRRSPNPLTRNYESSGPDVKIRGSAQHIADKYLALARDAQALGDRVMGENYLQHAEHYTRIILSAQSHENNARLNRHDGEAYKAEERNAAVSADEYGETPQPVIEGLPGEVTLTGRNSGYSADAEANEADESEGIRRPRRRLPARRSSQNRRACEEGGGRDAAAAAEETEQPPARRRPAAAAESAAAGESARKPARARRPRRVKPGETEHTDNI